MDPVRTSGKARGLRVDLAKIASQIIEDIDDAVIVADPDGLCLSANAAAHALTGYDETELARLRLSDLLVSPDAAGGRAASTDGGAAVEGTLRTLRRKGGADLLVRARLRQLDGFQVAILARPQSALARALHDSDEESRLLTEAARDLIIVHDLEGQILYANPAALDALGYAEAEARALRLADVFPAEALEAVSAHQAKCVAGNAGRHLYEVAVAARDGRTLPLEVSSVPLTWQGGAPAILMVARDISHRKHAEQTLRRAYDELEQRFQERTRALSETNARLHEQVAERERAEITLAQERYLLRTLIDSVPDYIYVKDLECRFLAVNRAHANHLGVEHPEDVTGKNDFDYYPRDLAKQYCADDQAVLRSGRPLIGKEEPGLDAEGNAGWVLTTKVPLRDANGDVIGLVGIGRDITRRKQTEEALMRIQEELEARVEARTADLQRLNAQLQAEIAARTRTDEMLRQHQHQLENLLKTARDLSSVLDLDELLRLIAERVVRLLDADECVLFRLEDDGITLRPILALGQYADEMMATSLRVGSGITGYSVAHNQPVTANNAQDDPRASHVPGTPEREQEHLMAAPLVFRERITGAMLVNRLAKPPFTEEDQNLLVGLVQQAAIAIENARLYESEREQLALAEALRDTAAALNTTLDFDEVIHGILTNVGRVVPHDTASVMLIESGVARPVRCRGYAERGIPESAMLGLRFTVSETANMRTMTETMQPVVIQNVLDAEGWATFPETAWIRSNVSAPICLEGKVIGFLDLNSAAPNAFTPAHAERLKTFADQAAIAIENARLYEQTQQRAAQLSTLNQIGRAVSSSLDRESIFEVIYEQLKCCLPVDAFDICLYSAETGQLSYPLVYDEGERYDEPSRPLEADPRVASVIQSGTPRLIHRESGEYVGVTPKNPIGNRSKSSASLLIAPLRSGERIIGTITAHSYQPRAYTDEHLGLLTGVATQAAIAIENARLYEQTQQRAAQLSTLNEIGRAVSSLLDVEAVLNVAYQQVQRSLALDVFFVCLWDPETDEVTFPLMYDSGQRHHEPPQLLPQGTVIAETIQDATPHLVNRTAEELAALANWHPVGDRSKPSASLMYAPMQIGERVIGAISAQSYSLHAYRDEHLRMLSGVAHQLAIAIENARLHTEVQRHAEELERRVEERTADLRQALARAQEADQAKTEFVSNVNHELRTPLSNLKLYLGLLRKGNPEKFTFYLDTLDREINRLSALVEDTLALASLGRTKQPDSRMVDLVETAREAVTRFGALADSRHITLDAVLPDEPLMVQADGDQIMRVLVNLLGNALVYTPGGGQVVVSARAHRAVGGQWAVVAVKDTGPGIAPEDQRNIFDPYFRGQVGRESGVPGSGLGLAIANEVIQLHHGRIELESAPGAGATFSVWLPLL